MRRMPVVGVMPLWDEKKDSLWMLPGYLEGLLGSGLAPFVLPLCADEAVLCRLAGLCDGFLFTGGQDVSPEIYGQEPQTDLLDTCKSRDRMELRLLELAQKEDKPVLGICRGIQFINAALGGSLYQDLPSQRPSPLTHSQRPPYDTPVHQVEILPQTPLAARLNRQRLAVNSCHHQAVKTLAPGLLAMALAEDGLVEALYRPKSRFLWAVQWHPEYSYQKDPASREIFRAFAEAMG